MNTNTNQNQQKLINEFIQITSCSRDESVLWLDMSNNNLENAIEMYFNNNVMEMDTDTVVDTNTNIDSNTNIDTAVESSSNYSNINESTYIPNSKKSKIESTTTITPTVTTTVNNNNNNHTEFNYESYQDYTHDYQYDDEEYARKLQAIEETHSKSNNGNGNGNNNGNGGNSGYNDDDGDQIRAADSSKISRLGMLYVVSCIM